MIGTKSEIKGTSPEIDEYFLEIDEKLRRCYAVAKGARSKGYDPEPIVDIPLASNLAERVVGLVSAVAPALAGSGVAERIQELEKQYGALAWEVALTIAAEVADGKFCSFKDKREALETGIRVGFAYHTTGVVSAPLEGFIELRIKKRKDGKDYFAAVFAGPIRGAGGTAAAFCLVIADFLRRRSGFEAYDPDEFETRRFVSELDDYHERVTNLQYRASEDEIEFLVKNCPIEVDGDPTEKLEVSNYKDLPRVSTNRIRGGVCLVVSMLAFKAPKLWKELKRIQSKGGFDLDWSFLEKFIALQKKKKSLSKEKSDDSKKLAPDYTFISDLVAGRPVITHPLRHGGFRLRYGKTRASGYSAAGISPATMIVLDRFVATGTQLKVERPGKAAAITPCDSIDGPIVRLMDGSVARLDSESAARAQAPFVSEILYLGDLLISYGDFFDRAHTLVPPGYCEEWFAEEAKKSVSDKFGAYAIASAANALLLPEPEAQALLSPPFEKPSAEAAIRFCEALAVPIHPFYTYFWSALGSEQFIAMLNLLAKARLIFEAGKVKLVVSAGSSPQDKTGKRALELLGIPHLFVNNEFVVIAHNDAIMLLMQLGIDVRTLLSSTETSASFSDVVGGKAGIITALISAVPSPQLAQPQQQPQTGLDLVRKLSVFQVRDKGGTFIGARMGRPEKAKMRKLTGSPHVLFPVGDEGGRLRSFQEAIAAGKVTADFPIATCPGCSSQTIYPVCENCGGRTKKMLFCDKCGVIEKCPHDGKTYSTRPLQIKHFLDAALKALAETTHPDLIKGVRGTSNKNHTPENLAKGVLRAKHELCVNKDGTVRYDMSELPLTHFTPAEVRTPVQKLLALGYGKDIHGNPLAEEHQVLELKPQDVILPSSPDSTDESSDAVLLRISRFVDELLMKFYKEEPFYRLNSKEDLVGHLVIGLAPHISAGIVGRIVGFSSTQAFFAHPLFHAAMRRDADGDEACVILLLDALINFSRQFLPDSRGAKTMDSPLVLTSRLIPAEVDDMAHRFDVVWRYPLELYEAAMQWKQPQDVKVELLGSRLHTPKQYEGIGFTHALSSINVGVTCSAYKTIPSMEEKLKGQMALAEKIRAVDAQDVARLVIEKHLLKDVRGNLRKFSTQQFRCLKCNTKFRRPPLAGVCDHCGGKILFTISEGSIVKYLEPAISLAEKYAVSPYLQQVLDLTKKRVESVFGREKEKQEGLGKWFG